MNRRNCQEVIKQMLEKIPTEKVKFIKDLEWNFEDAGYKAPEETLQWNRTMGTLMKHIAEPSEEWEFGVCHNRQARRHKKKGNVQFVLWKKGEQAYIDDVGHKEDVWINFDKSWWVEFNPNAVLMKVSKNRKVNMRINGLMDLKNERLSITDK